MRLRWMFSLACLAGLLFPGLAQAHFLWLLSETSADTPGRTVHLYFAEAAEPDDPDLLDRVKEPAVWQMRPDGTVTPLKTTKGEESLVATATGEKNASAAFGLSHSYGVITRGESTFLLKYYAKNYSSSDPAEWTRFDCSKRLALDVAPRWENGQLQLTVLWHGKPLADAEVKLGDGLGEDQTAMTSEKGIVSIPLAKPGLYSIRAKHVEEKAGELDGKKYADVRHYSTLSLEIPAAKTETAVKQSACNVEPTYAPVAEAVTSFGGAVDGNWLYVYSGHTGTAHQHSAENLSPSFRRLNLLDRTTWETLPAGQPLQGTTLVARSGKLYRVGGLDARNKRDEEDDLHSVNSAACFDTKSMAWQELPKLPEGRSSHDAAILGDKLYVFGGWTLGGEEDRTWHKHGLVLDLAAERPEWKKIEQPFERRALAVAAHDGKLYVCGGISSFGDISHEVDVYSPETGKWSQTAEIPGFSMNAFGCSAWSLGGGLYLSGMDGHVYRLNESANAWESAATLTFPRFFHRLLPAGEDRLLAVSGASTGGHTRSIEAIDLSLPPQATSVTTWTMPFPGDARRGKSLFLQGNNVYLVGGNRSSEPHAFDAANFLTQAWRIDLNEKSIRAIADLPQPRQSQATAVVGERRDATAYVAGGFGHDGKGSRGFAEVFQYDAGPNGWQAAKALLPRPLFMFGLAAHGKKLWAFGGRASNPHDVNAKNELSNTLLAWDTAAENGSFEPTEHKLPRQRHAFAGAVLDGKYFLVGGMGDGFAPVAESDVFDLEHQTWATIPSPARKRVFGELTALHGKLYLAGGFSPARGDESKREPNRSIEVYDPASQSWSTVVDELPVEVREPHLLALPHRLLIVGTPVGQDDALTLMFIAPADSGATKLAQKP